MRLKSRWPGNLIISLICMGALMTGINTEPKAQALPDSDSLRFPFINLKTNIILLPDTQTIPFQLLHNKLVAIRTGEAGTVHFLQLGDSHIQADYLTARLRDTFKYFVQLPEAGRGIVFPYRFAKTNNPENYRFRSSSHWESQKSVSYTSNGEAGLAGMSVYSRDSLISFSLKLLGRNVPVVPFSNATVYFQSFGDWKIEARGMVIDSVIRKDAGISSITFHSDVLIDSVMFVVRKVNPSAASFHLHGVFLSNHHSGYIYSALGSNGASTESALRCENLLSQLALVNPDVLILSFGTNDAYLKQFDRAKFLMQYDSLLNSIHRVFPELPILLTTPGDAWYRDHKHNANVMLVRNEIMMLAQEHHCAVWDLYSIMGGENSISKWYAAGLARKDRLHFSKEGYYLLGDLLAGAWANFYSSPISELCRK
jgi:lysophospholipase L1-like esterase